MAGFNPWLSMVNQAQNGLGVLQPEQLGEYDQMQALLGAQTPSPMGTPTANGFLPNPTPKKGNQPKVVPPPVQKKPPFDPFSGVSEMPSSVSPQQHMDEPPSVMDEINSMPELEFEPENDPNAPQPYYASDEEMMQTTLDEETPDDFVPQPKLTAQPTTTPLGVLPTELVPQQPTTMGDAKTRFSQSLDYAIENLSDKQELAQDEVDNMKEALSRYANESGGVDFTPLAALSDAWFGGNLTAAAKQVAPPSNAERLKTINDLQAGITKAQTGLTGDQLEAIKMKIGQESYGLQRDNALEIAKIQAEAKKATAGQGFGLRQKAFDEKVDARLDTDTQKLEKRIGDIAPGIVTKLKNLDTLIPGGLSAEENTEIPGVGVGAFMVPDFLMGDDASEIQANARGLAADLIKLQSGTAASDKEVDRKMKELGMAPGSKSSSFFSGLRRLKTQVAVELKNKEAGFRPDAVDAYRSRQGITYRDVESIGVKPKAPAGAMSFEQWKASGGQ